MRQISFAVAALLNQVNAGMPPTEGKYFYMDFKTLDTKVYKEAYGQHGAVVNVARSADKDTYNQYPLFFSTEETTIGLFSNVCTVCRVPLKYYSADSTNFKLAPDNGKKEREMAALYDKQDYNLQEVSFTGEHAIDRFSVDSTAKYQRETNFEDMQFLMIQDVDQKTSTTKKFTSDYSGFLGIAPWTANVDEKDQNFLYQLQQTGKIDSMTVAVRVNMADEQYNVPSTIKFGSYDTSNIQSGETMEMIRTVSTNSWDVKLGYFKFGADKEHTQNAFVRFDPGVPYVYLDKAMHQKWIASVNKASGSTVCNAGVNICKLSMPCNKVNFNFNMKFQLQDADAQVVDISIDAGELKVPGSKFGDSDDFCYLAVFEHGRLEGSNDQGQKNTIILGSIMMKRTYIVYDASNLDSVGGGKLQVGIAPLKTSNHVFGVDKNYADGATAAEGDSSVVSNGHPAGEATHATAAELKALERDAYAALAAVPAFGRNIWIGKQVGNGITYTEAENAWNAAEVVYRRFKEDENEKKMKEVDRQNRAARISFRKGESAQTFLVNESPNKPAWKTVEDYNKELTGAYNDASNQLKSMVDQIKRAATLAVQADKSQQTYIAEMLVKWTDYDPGNVKYEASQAYLEAYQTEIVEKKAQEEKEAIEKAAAEQKAKEEAAALRLQKQNEYLARALVDAKQFLVDGKHIADYMQDQRRKRDDYVNSGATDFPFKFGGAFYDDEFEIKYNQVFIDEDKRQKAIRDANAEKEFIEGKTKAAWEKEWREKHPRTPIPERELDQTWAEAAARALKEQAEKDKIQRAIDEQIFHPSEGARVSVESYEAKSEFLARKQKMWATDSKYSTTWAQRNEFDRTDLVKQADLAWENEKEKFGKEQEEQAKKDDENQPSTGGNEGEGGKDEGTGTGGTSTGDDEGKAGKDDGTSSTGKDEPEEEGGSAAVTVIIVLLVFSIIGALGYIIRKMNKDEKDKEHDPYGESGNGGINSDGLMGLPDPDTQQYGGKYSATRDDSVDSEHILPGVGDTPKYGLN